MEQGMPPAASAPPQRSSTRRWIIIGAVGVIGCCVLAGMVLAISGAALGTIGGLVGGLAGSSSGQLAIVCAVEAPEVGATGCAEWAQSIVNEYESDLEDCTQVSIVETDEGQFTDFQLIYGCLEERGLGPQ